MLSSQIAEDAPLPTVRIKAWQRAQIRRLCAGRTSGPLPWAPASWASRVNFALPPVDRCSTRSGGLPGYIPAVVVIAASPAVGGDLHPAGDLLATLAAGPRPGRDEPSNKDGPPSGRAR